MAGRIKLGAQAAGEAGVEQRFVATFRTIFSGSLDSIWHLVQAILPAAAEPIIGWLAVKLRIAGGWVFEVISEPREMNAHMGSPQHSKFKISSLKPQ